MRIRLYAIACVFFVGAISPGCRSHRIPVEIPSDTLRPTPVRPETPVKIKSDSVQHPTIDSASHSSLPPMARAIPPDRLAQFLPKLDGWSLQGETIKEITVRTNQNKSKVAQNYTQGNKKLLIEINDYAYVPLYYEPFDQFKGEYFQEDNEARTEKTRMKGYDEVQTWEKHADRATIFVFPGKRYVIKVVADNVKDVNEARALAEAIDLKGLENLQ